MKLSWLGSVALCAALTFNTHAIEKEHQILEEGEIWVTIGTDALPVLSKEFAGHFKKTESRDGVTILKIKDSQRELLSELMHDNFHRCGGFMVEDSYEEARRTINGVRKRRWVNQHLFADYSIDQQSYVKNMVLKVDDGKIAQVIEHLSSYHNRYYKAQSGVDSSLWIKSKWEELAANRPDVTVEAWEHQKFPQPSIILTIPGSTHPDEIVVIGGHADSIAGFWGGATRKAPGADDNASGIATMTEIIRIAMEKDYHPKKTVQFMAYAAEEVGLVGSKLIAQKYKADNKHVIGVIQLDMTNYKGTDEFDIVMMQDFTNAAQNTFLGELIEEYVHVPWGYSKCGYGCSDHASWTRNGYPASMPHEATMQDGNPHIHTDRDVIDQSDGHAGHAAHFAKLGLAYMVEMAK